MLRRDPFVLAASGFLLLIILTALLADILANERPLYCRYQGQSYFPAFTPEKIDTLYDARGKLVEVLNFQQLPWKQLEYEQVIWPPVPYGPEEADELRLVKASPLGPQYWPGAERRPLPFRFRHHLGTDEQGKDLLALLIHGSRVSMSVGLLAVGLAALLGILLGAAAGFFGDYRLRISRSSLLLLIPGSLLGYFYAFVVRQYVLKQAAALSGTAFVGELLLSLGLFACILAVFGGLGWLLARAGIGRRLVSLPVDTFISRIIELLQSLPTLLLLLIIAAIFKPGIGLVVGLIGLLGWTGIARFVRAEVLRIMGLEYLEAARALGFPNRTLLFRHVIPNALTPVWIIIAFGIGDAIMAEAALSFLNIGIPHEMVSWGKLLPKTPLEAWWLTLFPGLAIFLTVLATNILGERLRDWLDPRH